MSVGLTVFDSGARLGIQAINLRGGLHDAPPPVEIGGVMGAVLWATTRGVVVDCTAATRSVVVKVLDGAAELLNETFAPGQSYTRSLPMPAATSVDRINARGVLRKLIAPTPLSMSGA